MRRVFAFFILGVILLESSFLIKTKVVEISPPQVPKVNENFQPEIEKLTPEVSLSSEELEQGDTLLIKISGNQPTNAFFNGKKIDFFKIDSNWIGILGIDAKEKPGEYDLIINFKDSKIKKKIETVERKFPVTELSNKRTRGKGFFSFKNC